MTRKSHRITASLPGAHTAVMGLSDWSRVNSGLTRGNVSSQGVESFIKVA
ncbi:MAG: hypothetical protein AAF465_03155 [Pseudomonadota bacterium]